MNIEGEKIQKKEVIKEKRKPPQNNYRSPWGNPGGKKGQVFIFLIYVYSNIKIYNNGKFKFKINKCKNNRSFV